MTRRMLMSLLGQNFSCRSMMLKQNVKKLEVDARMVFEVMLVRLRLTLKVH